MRTLVRKFHLYNNLTIRTNYYRNICQSGLKPALRKFDIFESIEMFVLMLSLQRPYSLLLGQHLQQIKTQPLGVIVRSFKSAATKRVHDLGLFVGEKIWQRNYYEHIIRDEDDYQKIFDYISSNPINWEYDCENFDNI